MYDDISFQQRANQRINHSVADYWPLLALVVISILAALALKAGLNLSAMAGMHFYMGIALCFFAMLKLFDLPGFTKGFAMYDLVSERVAIYPWAYPFIELLLGLAYLGFFLPVLTYLLTIMIFGAAAIGVYRALQAGLDIHCPCMGSVLKVPLSTVSLFESISMAGMALLMLLAKIF